MSFLVRRGTRLLLCVVLDYGELTVKPVNLFSCVAAELLFTSVSWTVLFPSNVLCFILGVTAYWSDVVDRGPGDELQTIT